MFYKEDLVQQLYLNTNIDIYKYFKEDGLHVVDSKFKY